MNFVDRVKHTGAMHLLGSLQKDSEAYNQGREMQRLVFKDATDEELRELAEDIVRILASCKSNVPVETVLAEKKKVREDAQTPETWLKRYECEEPW